MPQSALQYSIMIDGLRYTSQYTIIVNKLCPCSLSFSLLHILHLIPNDKEWELISNKYRAHGFGFSGVENPSLWKVYIEQLNYTLYRQCSLELDS